MKLLGIAAADCAAAAATPSAATAAGTAMFHRARAEMLRWLPRRVALDPGTTAISAKRMTTSGSISG
jgi:hypothetical protein